MSFARAGGRWAVGVREESFPVSRLQFPDYRFR